MSDQLPRKRLLGGIVIGFLLIAIQWQAYKEWLLHRKSPEPAPQATNMPKLLPPSPEVPGAEILKNYALASTRPEDDLHAMAHVFANFRLLAKGDSFRLGANEEFAAALLGKNTAKEVFLSAPHACLNAKGQIIDRWGTALFFHVRDRDRVDIRSAGPDREMWTADDLHRLANGEWHRGAGLPE
jgi:hypothetical protein